MFSVGKFAPKQFIDSGLAMIAAGAAFLYLFRRYGYPNYYSHKTAAGYYVETSIPGVYVDFAIGHTTCYIYSTATEELYERYTQEEMASRGQEYSEFCRQVHQAVHDCLVDQLRPVRVDDERINILGETEFEWDEEKEQAVGEVPYKELEEKAG